MSAWNPGAYDVFLVDVDGVLVRGSNPIPGAIEAFGKLQEQGSTYIITNNSTRERSSLAMHLATFGLQIDEMQIVSSAYGAAQWLTAREGPCNVLSIGEAGLEQELQSAGHELVSEPCHAKWVVVGMCRQLTYALLADALHALLSGAQLLACNHDPTYPTPAGLLPGAGAMVGALRGMGFAPTHTIGKPSPDLYTLVADQLDTDASRMLMIGDRLDTDILGGNRFGADTLFVQSGVSAVEDIAMLGIDPTWIAADLSSAMQGHVQRPPSRPPA